jgi:serine/threonine protein kinase
MRCHIGIFFLNLRDIFTRDFIEYKKIEKKADVFATSSVICSIFTGDFPYDGSPGAKGYKVKDNLRQQLKEAALSEETIDLLIKGLSVDYNERPDASTLLEAIKKDMYSKGPKKAKIIEDLGG